MMVVSVEIEQSVGGGETLAIRLDTAVDSLRPHPAALWTRLPTPKRGHQNLSEPRRMGR